MTLTDFHNRVKSICELTHKKYACSVTVEKDISGKIKFSSYVNISKEDNSLSGGKIFDGISVDDVCEKIERHLFPPQFPGQSDIDII